MTLTVLGFGLTQAGVKLFEVVTPTAETALESSSNAELAQLYAADQQDRQFMFQPGGMSRASDPAFVQQLVQRDRARQARVSELDAAGAIQTGLDYYRAALIFQHGESVADIRQANRYALRAVDLGYDARQLVALTTDRLLVREGGPQRFGSQFRPGPVGLLVPYPIEAADAKERAELGLPPLWLYVALQFVILNLANPPFLLALGLPVVAFLLLGLGAWIGRGLGWLRRQRA